MPTPSGIHRGLCPRPGTQDLPAVMTVGQDRKLHLKRAAFQELLGTVQFPAAHCQDRRSFFTLKKNAVVPRRKKYRGCNRVIFPQHPAPVRPPVRAPASGQKFQLFPHLFHPFHLVSSYYITSILQTQRYFTSRLQQRTCCGAHPSFRAAAFCGNYWIMPAVLCRNLPASN